MPCPNGQCNYTLDPESKQAIEAHNGYFTCPSCRKSYDLLQDVPWHGPNDAVSEFHAGGGTRIGIPMQDQAQIGENLIQKMGQLPGYGAITWWHPGGATSQSPLDGATNEWGIEVKTIGYDSLHHRFVPGRPEEKTAKNNQAQEMGLQGVLGLLVILDYRRDKADIYAKEMPLTPRTVNGQTYQGVTSFRKTSAQHLIAEVPFDSPYKDPNNPAPAAYSMENYYNSPAPANEPAPTPASEMPF